MTTQLFTWYEFSILSPHYFRSALCICLSEVGVGLIVKGLPDGVHYTDGLYAAEIPTMNGIEIKYYRDPLTAFTTKRRAERKETIRQDKRLAMQLING